MAEGSKFCNSMFPPVHQKLNSLLQRAGKKVEPQPVEPIFNPLSPHLSPDALAGHIQTREEKLRLSVFDNSAMTPGPGSNRSNSSNVGALKEEAVSESKNSRATAETVAGCFPNTESFGSDCSISSTSQTEEGSFLVGTVRPRDGPSNVSSRRIRYRCEASSALPRGSLQEDHVGEELWQPTKIAAAVNIDGTTPARRRAVILQLKGPSSQLASTDGRDERCDAPVFPGDLLTPLLRVLLLGESEGDANVSSLKRLKEEKHKQLQDLVFMGGRVVLLFKEIAARDVALKRLIAPSGRELLLFFKFVR